jgi:hypothetical protein
MTYDCKNEIQILGEAADAELAQFGLHLFIGYDEFGNATAFIPRNNVNESGVIEAERVPSLLKGKTIRSVTPSTIITATGSPNWTIEISNGRARYVCKG